MLTLPNLRFWVLALVLSFFPALILLENAMAQSGAWLAARFPDGEQTSLFHEGTSSSSQVAVLFNQPIWDFEADTPSVVVEGGVVDSVEITTLEVFEGTRSPLYVFNLRAGREWADILHAGRGRTLRQGRHLHTQRHQAQPSAFDQGNTRPFNPVV